MPKVNEDILNFSSGLIAVAVEYQLQLFVSLQSAVRLS
jgi:hypothetical protein